jgi:L-threonylcarbamoyladenylate synthase
MPHTAPSKEIVNAVELLRSGELVALPTETVYGLGADAANESAVAKIFAAKGRPADHPLIVHVARGVKLDMWAVDIPRIAKKLTDAFWPGPLTLILKKSARIPKAVTGGQETVGLRCPAHPLAQQLLVEFAKVGSGIIAAPSANKFGHISPTTAQHVRAEFGEQIMILDGGSCEVGIESTILDLSRMRSLKHPILLRPGAITPEMIAKVIGEVPLSADDVPASMSAAATAATPRVSGSLAAHYAPLTLLRLLKRKALQEEADQRLAAGKRVAVLAFASPTGAVPSPPGVGVKNVRPLVWIVADRAPAAYARDLYAHLRTLDAAQTTVILVEAPPATAAWEAVNDRLGRAAVGSGRKSPS